MPQLKQAASPPERVLDFIELSGAIMEKTAAMVAVQDTQNAAYEKLIPVAVHALLENERIEPHEKEAAARVLRDPIQALEILIKTAAHRNDAERAAKLGQPEKPGQSKQASFNSLKNAYVGRRDMPDAERESDKIWNRGFGIK